MNFKQDSEREIKRRERHGEQESDCDLTHTRRPSQRHPYLPEEIWNKFHVRHIPFQTRGTISIFTTRWKLLQPSVRGDIWRAWHCSGGAGFWTVALILTRPHDPSINWRVKPEACLLKMCSIWPACTWGTCWHRPWLCGSIKSSNKVCEY